MDARGIIPHFVGCLAHARTSQEGADHPRCSPSGRCFGSVRMSARDSDPHIGLVVEGPGDKAAAPLLLRRILHTLDVYEDVLGKPIPTNGRGAMTTPGGIEGFVAAAAARPGCRVVIVVADVDDDLSCELGPELLKRASSVVSKPVVIVLAERCFEDWIYASYETLELDIPEHSPQKRGANVIKHAVASTGSKYVKSVWQPRLTNRIDISTAASRSGSLERLLLKIEDILRQHFARS